MTKDVDNGISTGPARSAPRTQALRLAAADAPARPTTGLTPLLLGLLLLLATRHPGSTEEIPQPGAPSPAPPSATDATSTDLSSLTLEQLINVQVTTVSRRPENLSQTAAAATVITQEDIHRSGATTIADALRLAPGLEVSRVDAHTWAISSRGFNDTFANKLLVLMDGRSVYTPLFSGVYWDVQDTMIEDIDRIEVIRGPGATLWGANAVNGVINIITRNARDTQSGLFVAGGGTEELGFAALRYGGKLSETAAYRIYTKYSSRDSSALGNGDSADDRWMMGRVGFRTDWEPSGADAVTFQGDSYAGYLDQTYRFTSLTSPGFSELVSKPIDVNGGNLLGRWNHAFSAESDSTVQVYYDRTRRDARGLLTQELNTCDLDAQHHQEIGERQQWMVGAGYRLSSDIIDGSFQTGFTPRRRTTRLFSCFAQDEITVVPDHLHLILGSKLEHNVYTGFEVQPAARLAWMPDQHQTVWASVARAVRTPSRAENDIQLSDRVIPGAPPTLVAVYGSDHFESERLLAFETGYRLQPHARVSCEISLFYNLYDELRTTQQGGVTPAPSLPGSPNILRLNVDNRATGETFGGELMVNWHPAGWWHWRASYTLLETQLHPESGNTDTDAEDDEGKNPHHQLALSSSMDLPGNLQLDATTRYVDRLSELRVHGYLTLDLRLAWKPTPRLEFSVVGQNLLDDRHPEFRPTIVPTQNTEVQRAVYGKISWAF